MFLSGDLSKKFVLGAKIAFKLPWSISWNCFSDPANMMDLKEKILEPSREIILNPGADRSLKLGVRVVKGFNTSLRNLYFNDCNEYKCYFVSYKCAQR